MAPEISIITVAFNSGKTIARTIASVLGQSFQNFEYIIIDGGSTDGTNAIIDGYKSSFNGNLIHVTEPDKGIYDAMNKGIALAKGKVIGLLNSDDHYFENTLAVVHKAYCASDQKSVLTGELLFVSGTSAQVLRTSQRRFLKKIGQYKNGVRHPATFLPKIVYDQIGLFDLEYKIAADADLIFRIYRAGYTFVFIDQPLVVMTDQGISNSKGITGQIVKEKGILLKTYCSNRVLRAFYLAETNLRFMVKEHVGGLLAKYRKFEGN